MGKKQQTHEAGRHLAVGQALLSGRSASIAGHRTHIEVNGQRAAVMVAGKGAWMIKNIETFMASSSAAYVLVNITGPVYEFFVAPGDELRRDVRQRHERFLARVVTRPRNSKSLHSNIKPQDVTRWADNWALFDRAQLDSNPG
ncbi:hypothetical protein KBX53_02910 [Micromonospora sp. M51]|uniref:hypothetical protein n=1 Tax=Micromonospora sp. M51 TaxID=2824889 RepID=UPI001B366F33|nr:hypothetical protein [Micromonospora sp. M51]MBQ1009916.1 hypothetical protein [Micromonospora sp. M51]